MSEESLVCNFSGVYQAQGFTDWLGSGAGLAELSDIEGTVCYCDVQARDTILKRLPEVLPFLRWIDSGDFHYMTKLLASFQTEPFHLILLDNHPDNQDPAFEGVLSCGSWVKEMREENPLLKDVLTIGPEGCPRDIPDGWMESRRGERVYVSLDKDILSSRWARTDWSQGDYSLDEICGILERILSGPMEVSALDICGELSPSKGASPEDLRINFETNIKLHKLIERYVRN